MSYYFGTHRHILTLFSISDSADTIALTTRYVLIGDGGRMDIGGPEDECRSEGLF